MAFFAELDGDAGCSPFSIFYERIRSEKLKDFMTIEECYKQAMPKDLHYPFIEGFGPPLLVEFIDRVV